VQVTTDNGSNFVAAFKRFEVCYEDSADGKKVKEDLVEPPTPPDNIEVDVQQSLRLGGEESQEREGQGEHAEGGLLDITSGDDSDEEDDTERGEEGTRNKEPQMEDIDDILHGKSGE
jgi:hypothetical protein